MAEQPSTIQMVAGEEVLRRPGRALIGWMSEQEGVVAMLGRNPLPNENLDEYRERLGVAHKAVNGLPARDYRDPIVDDPYEGLSEIASRPEVAANFPGMRWRTAVADLTRVLSFQKIIFVDGLDERLAGGDEPDRLLEICLPTQQPAPPSGALSDPDGKGFTISSFNPNLRIAGGQLHEAYVNPGPNVPSVRMQGVTLFVYMGTSYIQVVRYKGRSFIRDGYHRAAGLLRLGITRVPCIFVEADSFEQVGMVPGAFTYEVLFGERPPFLADFWHPDVAVDVSQLAVRKVVRIRGEEFVVPR